MSVCKYCSTVGGWHSFDCPAPHAPTAYRRQVPPTTRIEITGNIQVHHPVRPVKP